MRNRKTEGILTAIKQGLFAKDIAALFGVSLNTVYRTAKAHNLTIQRYTYNRQKVIQDVLNGNYATYEEAARDIGVTRQAIYAMVKGAKNERG